MDPNSGSRRPDNRPLKVLLFSLLVVMVFAFLFFRQLGNDISKSFWTSLDYFPFWTLPMVT